MAYATSAQLQAFTGKTAPAGADRLLERATEVIDEAVIAIYQVDENGIPTDADLATALANATCAQVEYWMAVDEERDISGPVERMRLGPLEVYYGASDNRSAPTYLAPRAKRILLNAGLLFRAVSS